MDLVIINDRHPELIDSFIRSRDVAASSRILYRKTLAQFFNWITRRGYLLSGLSFPHLIEYKEDLLAAGKSSLTAGSYLTSVKLFYEWAEANKLSPNISRGIKNPPRKQQFRKQPLLPDQVTQLLTSLEGSPRDYAIINLIVRTGLRCIEVTRANVEDITFKAGQRILLVHGKGRAEKDNYVKLTDKAFKPIADYLATRGKINPGEPLFTGESNNKPGRLTTRTISLIAKEALKGIGLNSREFTAHSLRHTAATSILRAGGTTEKARETLRHTSLATTEIYLATLKDERRMQSSGEDLIDNLY